ncbi:hypothetical protein ACWDTT_30850, partial [Streptosporangium sandarakinum]
DLARRVAAQLPPGLSGRFDVVGFDPRGVGRAPAAGRFPRGVFRAGPGSVRKRPAARRGALSRHGPFGGNLLSHVLIPRRTDFDVK